MSMKDIAPWRWGGLRQWSREDRPYQTFRREMESLHEDMDRLFEEFWNDSGSHIPMIRSWHDIDLTPRVDETEDENAFHVKVELPGLDKDDVEVTLTDGVLTIRGEKKREEEEKGKNFYRKERSFGSFRRSLPIPVDVDDNDIEARFDKGILYVRLPKTEESLQNVRHIPVKAA
jgi:HSP20 family protein